MDENFRRAYRRMTGKSLLGLSGIPDRREIQAFLSSNIDTAHSIAIREHLDHSDQTPDPSASEYISEAQQAQKECQAEFNEFRDELKGKFADFRQKWSQRYTVQGLLPQLKSNSRIVDVGGEGFRLELGTTKKEMRDFYFETIHFVVGDAEKLVVTTSARVLHIQKKLAQQWYRESISDSFSKVLPTMEAGLRDCEADVLRTLRQAMIDTAQLHFSNAFKRRKNSRSFRVYKSEENLVRNIGDYWNQTGIWENGFRAFLEDYTDYAKGICHQIIDWYEEKWFLFLRGFSRGQLDLFAAPAKQEDTSE